MLVVGVDGTKRGWVAVELFDGCFAGAQVHSRFAEVVAHDSSPQRHRHAATVDQGLLPLGL